MTVQPSSYLSTSPPPVGELSLFVSLVLYHAILYHRNMTAVTTDIVGQSFGVIFAWYIDENIDHITS